MDLPEAVAEHPLLAEDAWVALRDDGIAPLVQSELVTTEQSRAEFLVGAWLLGLLDTIQPQMLRVSDALTAGKLMNAVIMPRRSSKTTSLFCVLLGRCYLRPVHLAGFTLLTTQKKTAERYRLDMYGPISRRWPDSTERAAFAKGAPVKLVKSNGGERVEFSNGSVLSVLSPEGDAVRSGAYDTLLLDESGEASLTLWEDVIGAVIPSFDTRPEGQLILAGTAGDYRGGSEFWNTLNDPEAGVIRYTLPDEIDPEELVAWEPDEEHPLAHAGELIQQMHPGLYGLTTLDRIANSFKRLGVKKFTREYFGLFGAEGSNVSIISMPKWTSSTLPLDAAGRVAPTRFSFVTVVNPTATYAAVGVAWIGRDKRVHVGLIHHQAGVTGFGKKVLTLSRKWKKIITWDGGSNATAVEINQLRESRPKPTERVLVTRDIGKAAVHFTNLINQDRLRHHDQPELTNAVEIATKRAIGQFGAWGFGGPKGKEDYDIVGLEAVALAAYALDQEKAPRSIGDAITFG
ncbi:hypothetical protein [Microbacterium invictum]|uniref:Terminase n=1 Tax=Microbacterium invictum TaxID=515415 RepID=A0ABZ0VEB5_9MICO|nr:hypothetical protein [Microbacterium invictum]WQB71968.1 hypothetical protein T9R20_08495 [Microbacterium invictum]